jgi:WhiB family redox-sensing transcriptional regulator
MQICRDQALALQEPYGIWGGLSEDDREAILNRRGVALINPVTQAS